MPLPKRSIVPVHVARSVYHQEGLVSVELETVTNTTLTNIIRQLSSLSKHAEDVFGELARDVGNIGDRANSLQARIDRLAIKVTQLDSTGEEVPLTDITRKKAFKSAKAFDQQIFSRATMPAPMLETYAQCDKPPPLDKLNVYRDDGKDGLKFYTDPNYFFELWRQEMLKDTERVMHDKVKKTHRPRQEGAGGVGGGGSSGGAGRGHKKRVRTPHNTREKQRQIAIGHGETLMPNNVIYRTPNSVPTEDPGYGTQLVEIQTQDIDSSVTPSTQTTLGTLGRQGRQHAAGRTEMVAITEDFKEFTASLTYVKPYNMLMHLENNSNFTKQTAVAITGMGIYEQRPARPNSIELRRSYGQSEQIDGGGNGVYGTMSPQAAAHYATSQYASTNGMQHAQHLQQQQQQQQQQQAALQQQMYDEAMYHHQQQQQHQQSLYGQSGGQGNAMMSPDGIYAPGTPTRNKLRPSQPPPAPPSNGSSGGTPNASNANTPTRGRSMSTSRDALPPPPPIPDGMINTTSPSQMLAAMNGGSNHIAAKLLGRTNSTTRAGSPQVAPSNSVQDANAMVMAQLNNTINTFNNMNINDLPPPPPVPDQHSPKLSPPPNAAPPPPPPPPPLDDNGMMSAQLHQQMLIKQPMMTNGEMQMQHQQQQANGMIMQGGVMGGGQQQQQQQLIVGPKKMMPPLHDTRTDLMKAIRDGITLRKVEKIEQKEIERNIGLHDVASILARRVAIELSESEESDSDEDDSEDWVEPNETSA